MVNGEATRTSDADVRQHDARTLDREHALRDAPPVHDAGEHLVGRAVEGHAGQLVADEVSRLDVDGRIATRVDADLPRDDRVTTLLERRVG